MYIKYCSSKRRLLLAQLAAGNVSGLRHCSALLVGRSSSGHFVLVRRAAEHDPEHLGLRRRIPLVLWALISSSRLPVECEHFQLLTFDVWLIFRKNAKLPLRPWYFIAQPVNLLWLIRLISFISFLVRGCYELGVWLLVFPGAPHYVHKS